MDTPVSLTLREVLASSSDIATYMHDQTRKRRVPIDSHPETMARLQHLHLRLFLQLSKPTMFRSLLFMLPLSEERPQCWMGRLKSILSLTTAQR